MENKLKNSESSMKYTKNITNNSKVKFEIPNYLNEMNLDLSYITPRIIAMSFPDKEICNDPDKVYSYLNTIHKNHYKIYNVSGKDYIIKIFDGNFVKYNWIDHYSPPFSDLFSIVKDIKNYLEKDDENIAVLHCIMGRGRTGTACCSLFLLLDIINDYKKAEDFYSLKRFGLTIKTLLQPSQNRYLTYLQKLMANKDILMINNPIIITSIDMKGIPLENVTYEISCPYFKKSFEEYNIDNGCFVIGDFTISLYSEEIYPSPLLPIKKCIKWFSFNTAFLDKANSEIKITDETSDPKNIRRITVLPEMEVIIKYRPFNIIGNKEQDINNNNKLQEIRSFISSEEEKIKQINSILKELKQINSSKKNEKLIFGNYKNDIEEILSL